MASDIQRLAEDVVETYFRWVSLLLLQCIMGAFALTPVYNIAKIPGIDY